MIFEETLQEKVIQAERAVYRYLPEVKGYQKNGLKAINYSVNAGGKRLRPVIMKAVFEMCGGTDRAVIEPFMAAIEMIHTYSLVHDDLPAMDDDAYRRGKPTTHKKFGEAMGILAGDALLNLAYETAFLGFDGSASPKRISKALKVLGRKSGIYGMVGGQVVDVEENGRFVDEDTLMYVCEAKTAALVEASFMIGGILAGASEKQVKRLEQVGRKLGVAFQIQDDILDRIGDEKKIGKPVHSDEKNEKSTFAAIYGIELSKEKVKQYTEEAVNTIQGFSGDKEFLIDLMIWLIDRDK